MPQGAPRAWKVLNSRLALLIKERRFNAFVRGSWLAWYLNRDSRSWRAVMLKLRRFISSRRLSARSFRALSSC